MQGKVSSICQIPGRVQVRVGQILLQAASELEVDDRVLHHARAHGQVCAAAAGAAAVVVAGAAAAQEKVAAAADALRSTANGVRHCRRRSWSLSSQSHCAAVGVATGSEARDITQSLLA